MSDRRAFGTEAGIFGCYGNVVAVAMISNGGCGLLSFHYSSEQLALGALKTLREGLETSEEGRKLRASYSLGQVLDYLRVVLPRSGMEHIERPATLFVDRTKGLREQRGKNSYGAVGVEQLMNDWHKFRWEVVGPCRTKPSEQGLWSMKALGLDCRYRYETQGRVLVAPASLGFDGDYG